MVHSSDFVEGVTRISSAQPGPILAIIGSLHGNEPCGLRAIERLESEFATGELALASGSLMLVHGNPEATRQYRRFSAGGADLNRIFDFSFLDTLPLDEWAYEHHRAVALRPLVEEWTAALDLHSASFPTAPFGIWPYGTPPIPMLRRMGVDTVTRSWDGLGLPGSQALISVLSQQRRPALAIECGQHEEPEAVDRAYMYARRFLAATGVIEEPAPFVSDTRVLEMLTAIKKPTDSYRFPRDLRGFTVLEGGEDLGDGIRIESTSIAIMPNDRVPVGGDMLYLARPSQ